MDPSNKFTKEQMGKLSPKLTELLGNISLVATKMGLLENNQPANSDIKKQKNIKNKYSILITPKNKDTSTELQKKIQRHFKTSQLGICIEGIKKISQNRIVIDCIKKEDAKKLQTLISNDLNDIDCKELTKKKPTMIFKGIFNDYIKEDFTDDILDKNEDIKIVTQKTEKNSIFNIKAIIKNKYSDTANYIVEVDSTTRKILLNKEKINIGYQRVTVDDAIPVVQCYFCLRYGHTSRNCNQKEKNNLPSCSHCGSAHLYKDCPARTNQSRCANCTFQNDRFQLTFPTNHNATDKTNCMYYKKMLAFAQQKIEY